MFEIPLIKPFISSAVKAKVMQVLDSGYLTQGPVTQEFESVARKYVGACHCIATTSCTTGLELALRALGIGQGHEVIVPDYTYPATASAVAIVGAKPVLVDIDPDTMLIDYDEIEKAVTDKTRAVIPVSLFGNPLDWDRLNRIKAAYPLYIIEDAACAIGSAYKGEKTGSLADISVFSLHPRKFITAGEGGLVTTDNDAWADWMTSYKHFGMGSQRQRNEVCFERIGTNYKMSDVNAAIGLAQMSDIARLLSRRAAIVRTYLDLISDLNAIKPAKTTRFGVHSYQTFCVFVENRDKVIQAMRAQGIEAQIGTYSLHMHPAFMDGGKCRWQGDLSKSGYVFHHCLALPLYPQMDKKDPVRVIETLKEILRQMNI